MRSGLTEEHEMYLEVAQRFVESELPIASLREVLGTRPDDRYLDQTAELGWYAGFVPESHGGGSVSGLSVLDAAVVGEVIGAALQPAPVIASALAARALAAADDPDAFGDALAAALGGRACYVFGETERGWDAGVGLTLRADGDAFLLEGAVNVVAGIDTAQWLVVAADAPDGVAQVAVPVGEDGVTIHTLESLDLTRSIGSLHCSEVPVAADAILSDGDASASISDIAALSGVMLAAEQVGAMRRIFEVTLQYSRDRIAFGRPIGSFQAIKHQIADLSMMIEFSSAIADEAAVALQHRRPEAHELASVAQAYVSESGIAVTQGCLQLHGGIGYTWEHDLHLYLRRLASDAQLYGSPSWHRVHLWEIDGLVPETAAEATA